MRQLIPFHEAVDLSLWPSPFDPSISKRKLEKWYFHVRAAIRLLHEADHDKNRLETTGRREVHVNVPSPDLDFLGGSVDCEMDVDEITGRGGWSDTMERIIGSVLLEPPKEPVFRVTTLIHKHSDEFDPQAALVMMKTGRCVVYSHFPDRKAANSGTWMHAMLEHMFNGYQIAAGDMQGELDATVNIVSQMGDIEAYRTEWCIYAPNEDVAGSIDMVLKRRDSPVFYLVDWKRSEKLEDKYNGFGKTMKAPLESVADCQGQHYRLQLNMYKWILEKYYGIQIHGMKVVCIHPRYLPDGFVDDVPNMQGLVSELMQCRRNKMQCRRNKKLRRDRIKMLQSHRNPFVKTNEVQARASPREGLSPTERFSVVLPSQPSVVESMAELEAMIEDLVDDQDNGAPNNAKKRRLLPGADTHSRRFQDMFRRSHTILSNSLDNITPDISPRTNTILHNTRRMLGDLRAEYPDISEDIRRMMLVAAHLAEGHLVDKPMMTDCAALTWIGT
ncbi:unnamed protein product [Symbiodinium microadriaticum]|nr:unnamed protein product [Symbiodinium microadriaticum]